MREDHPRYVMRRRGRERVEVAVRVEINEREVGLRGERAREGAGNERALAAEDNRRCAFAHGCLYSVGEAAAGLPRGAQPAVTGIEGNAHALLRAKDVCVEVERLVLVADEHARIKDLLEHCCSSGGRGHYSHDTGRAVGVTAEDAL